MKIADNRQALHHDKVPAWMHHIACDCGSIFGHEPSKGTLCTCPDCKRSEDVPGADISRIAGAQ